MNKACHELCVSLDSVRSLTAPDGDALGGALPAAIAEELLAQARAVDERATLEIRFVAADAEAVHAEAIATRVHAHFARVAQRHGLQIRDIFRFARVSTAVGLLCVVVLLAGATDVRAQGALRQVVRVRSTPTIDGIAQLARGVSGCFCIAFALRGVQDAA